MAHKTNGDDIEELFRKPGTIESIRRISAKNEDGDVPRSLIPFSMNNFRFHLRIGTNEDSPAITIRWGDLTGQNKFLSFQHRAVDEFIKKRHNKEHQHNGKSNNNNDNDAGGGDFHYDNFEVEIKYYFSKPYTAPNWWQIISGELDFMEAILDNQEQKLLQMIATIERRKTTMIEEEEEVEEGTTRETTPTRTNPTPTRSVARNLSQTNVVATHPDVLMNAQKVEMQPIDALADKRQAMIPPTAFKPPSPRSVVAMSEDPFVNPMSTKGHTTVGENKERNKKQAPKKSLSQEAPSPRDHDLHSRGSSTNPAQQENVGSESFSVMDCQVHDLESLGYRENEYDALESINGSFVKTSPPSMISVSPQQHVNNTAAAVAKRPVIDIFDSSYDGDDDDDDVVYVGTKKPAAKRAKVVAETSASASVSNNPRVVGLANKIMGLISEFDKLGLTGTRTLITLLAGYTNKDSQTPKDAWRLLLTNKWIQYSDSETVRILELGRSQTQYLSVSMPTTNEEQQKRVRSVLKSIGSAKGPNKDVPGRLFNHIVEEKDTEIFQQEAVSKVLGYKHPGSSAPKDALKLLTALGILAASKGKLYKRNDKVTFPIEDSSSAISEAGDNYSSVERWEV